jgi:hypothetical protein
MHTKDGKPDDALGKLLPFRPSRQRKLPEGETRLGIALAQEALFDVQPRRGCEEVVKGLTPLGACFVIRIEGCLFQNKLRTPI